MPKGEPKVTIQYEGTVSQVPWLIDVIVQLYVGSLAWSIILHKPELTNWLVSWLPGI